MVYIHIFIIFLKHKYNLLHLHVTCIHVFRTDHVELEIYIMSEHYSWLKNLLSNKENIQIPNNVN